MAVVEFISIFLSGILAHEAFRRFPKTSSLFFLALPCFLLPLWIERNPDCDWLFWVKLFSAIVSMGWILAVRIYRPKAEKWAYLFGYGLVILNLLEPGIRLICAWSFPLLFNCLAWLMLIASLPRLASLGVGKEKFHDLLWDVPYPWILGYSLCVCVFINLIFPDSAMRVLAGILAPLAISFFNRQLYFQARASTLCFYLILGFTYPSSVNMLTPPAGWRDSRIELALSIFSFAWMLVYTIYRYSKSSKYR